MHTHAGRPPLLANPRADRVKKVAGLAGRSARSRSGLVLVEGPQAVRELLKYRPASVRDVYITQELLRADASMAELAYGATKWVHPVTSDVARAMSGDAQGILAVASAACIERELPPVAVGASLSLLALAQGRDPGNVGTMIRTADAMGASAVVVVSGTVDVTSPKVVRSSAGSVFHLPIVPVDSFAALKDMAMRYGVLLLGTAGGADSQSLVDLSADAIRGRGPLAAPHAWVMGNEAQGLSVDEREACDYLVRIPMTGDAESLNVASAAAICLYASQCARGIDTVG
ncbi:TrmH family RNA methyltransferase [Schaalia suimastitidis]|uniref:TrmH family RNA methyltransferase n=1 Tax=Schaalia suimastitidis TaxID=121163 RepID=UPI0004265412|nr:RNA methyltransferase [Schaalia suimastitidis]